MARYVLDTGIILGYLRSAPWAEYVKQVYDPLGSTNLGVISIVTHGELQALAFRQHYGTEKIDKLTLLLQSVPTLDLNKPEIIKAYAEILVFSQGKHPSKMLPSEMSSRTMGENDIWIAATTVAFNGELLTLDHGFDHLDKEFFRVHFIDQASKPSP
jgi:predicted nucleic acid-binding protein